MTNPLTLRQRLGALIAGTARRSAVRAQRTYAAAKPSRFNTGLGSSGNSSADAELAHSLTRMRAASRQMMRDASYAKRVRTLVVNNVIGPGIGLQAQVKTTRGELFTRVNDSIEQAHAEWSCGKNCHTGGALHLNDLERMALGQVVEAGDVLIRMYDRAFGDSAVPLALEIIEAERLADSIDPTAGARMPSATVRMGVECDEFGRAVAYWIRKLHPGDIRQSATAIDYYERVPAEDIIHLRVINRWPQTRGEPWLHTVLGKIDSIDQYSNAELHAAQADATQFATIEVDAPDVSGNAFLADNSQDQTADNAKPEISIQDGMVQELGPGEKMVYHSPKRPNTAIDPFLRYMLREVAAGAGVSYESLSRDYSQSNYSSSRLALLDDRDTWRTLQQWWIRSFRLPLYKRWLARASLAGAIEALPIGQYAAEPEKFEAVKFKPRGWSWIDPVKEVAAYKEAEKAGYISAEDIIAQTANGLDIEDVVDGMKRSAELYEEAGIVRDTDVAASNAAAQAKAANNTAAPPDPEEPDDAAETAKPNDPPKQRVVSLARP